MKAFKSTLEDLEERRSIASTQSFQSMRGIYPYYRLSTGGYSHEPLNSGRGAIASLMQRTSGPQPYPYYHHQQARTPSPNLPPSPQAIVIENGRHGGGTVAFVAGEKIEKVPLVQRWSPSSGSSSSAVKYSIGKSMSIDTPVAIAHV